MKNNRTIGVRTDSQTWEMLIALEKYSGKTKSDIIREMLNHYVLPLYNKIPKGDKNEN